MLIKDKIINVMVDVDKEECDTFDCYWPWASEDSFMPKRGGSKNWICSTRHKDKCPTKPTVAIVGFVIEPKKNTVKIR